MLRELQASVKDILQADPYFSNIKLVTEDLLDVSNTITTSLSKLGIVAIILTPDSASDSPDAPGPILNPVNLNVEIVELVMANRSQSGSRKPASDVAEHTAWRLHYPNHAGTRTDPWPLMFKRLRIVPDKQFLIYRIEFTTTGVLAGITEES